MIERCFIFCRNWSKCLLPLATVISCSGCYIGSLQPFYMEEAVVQMPQFEGSWENVEKNEDGSLERTALEWTGQRIQIGEDKIEIVVRVVLFKIDNVLFADTQDEELGDAMEERPHKLYKVNVEENRLIFVPLDFVWLQKQVDAGAVKLSYRQEGKNEDVLFTSTRQEWAAFIEEYNDNPDAFPAEDEFVIERKR